MGRDKEFLDGYLIVELNSFCIEKFINLAYNNGIKLWDINRKDLITVQFKISSDDFKKIKKVAKITNSKIKIVQKKGLGFYVYKVLKRKLFILGIIVFIFILYYLSNLIWIIDIRGNKNISNDEIVKALYKNGIKIGVMKNKLDLKHIENNIVNEIKQISLISLSIDGVKLNVEVVERTLPPEIVDIESPVDIIAKKDGIVTKIFCYRGTPLIKPGEYVKKGQILITGDIFRTNRNDNSKEYVKTIHSIGSVYAKVWYEIFEEQELIYNNSERTGNYIKNEYMIINGKKIYINKNDAKFENYDKIENRTKINLLGYNIPIEKVEEKIYELKVTKVNYSIDEAIEIAKNKAEQEIKKQIPKDATILDKKYDKIIEKNKVKVRLLIITEENISYEQHR
jgi:similar to stage IV sporulation protein